MKQFHTLSRGAVIGLAVAIIGCTGESGDDHAGHDHAGGADAHRSTPAAEAFCEEHQIAEASCVWCDSTLVETLGWCRGHSVPEAYCYQCNPALIPAFKAAGDWCGGHDRPESQCYICNPELDPAKQERSAVPSPSGVSVERMADTEEKPRSQRAPSVTCTTESLIVRFDGPEIADQAGLEYAQVEERPVTKTLECNAEVAYDGNRYAKLASQVPGVISKVHVDLGDRVKRGAPLVTIQSPELGAAKASYLQAQAQVRLWEQNHARETDLIERGVSTERDVLEAQKNLAESRAALSGAEQQLLGLGLSPGQIESVAESGDTGTRYTVSTPFSGIVVDRDAVIGEVVDRSKRLYAIADVASMWALLDVYETEARQIRTGQPVVLRVDGLPGQTFGGEITWVSSALDPRTRTLRARAQLDNSDGALKANMFASAIVSVREQTAALVVPEEAVQWEGCCNVVFVRRSPTLFEPRKVHLGVSTGTAYEVLSGLEAGEQIVVQGSFLLKTEILKGNLGAGCCEVQRGV